MNELILDKANIEDAEELQKVLFSTWMSTYPNEEVGVLKEDIQEFFKDSFTESVIEKRKKRISDYLNSDTKILLVAKKNGKIIGFCNGRIEDTYNQIQAIYVLPEYQCLGVGKLLFEKVKHFFNNTKDIIIEVVDYNKKAIDFYKKLGFEVSGKIISNEQLRMPCSNIILPEIEMVLKHK